MNVHLGRDRQNATQMMTVAHAVLGSLTMRVEELGHELYMDCSFSLDISDDLYTRCQLLWNCQEK
jgi:hypothetical protein